MALELYACETKTGKILAQLPGAPDGPLAREASGFSSATFTIPTGDPAFPANWRDLLEAHRCSILAVDERDGVRHPAWFGLINQVQHRGTGLSVQAVTLEWLLDARRAADAKWGLSTDLMRVVRDLVGQFEAGGAGAGLKVDAPDAGVLKAWSVKRSDAKSFKAALEELGVEWSIELAFDPADAGTVVRTLRARRYVPGAEKPVRTIQVPAHTSTWSWTASRLESQAATVVYVEGDGTGDTKTVSTPVVDTAREAAGYPRTEAWESVTGVTSVTEAASLADQFAAQRFLGHEQVELTALNGAAGAALAGLSIGDAVRVVIDTDTLQKDATYRLASWELDPTGATWTPVLAPAGLGLQGWRRPTAKSQALAVREVGKPKSADPLGVGYKFKKPNPDGDTLTLDPEKGVGWTTPDGGWKPIGGTTTGGGGTPAGDGWGDPTGGSAGPKAAGVRAEQTRTGPWSTSTLDTTVDEGAGRYYCLGPFSSNGGSFTSTEFSYTTTGQARPTYSRTVAAPLYGGTAVEGAISDPGVMGTLALTPEVQALIVDRNPGWALLASMGVTSGTTTTYIMHGGPTYGRIAALAGGIVMPVSTKVANGSYAASQKLLLRWALGADGTVTGEPEIVLGSSSDGLWGGYFSRVNDTLAAVWGGGTVTLLGFSERGVEKTWALPGINAAEHDYWSDKTSSAILMATDDGTGKRLVLSGGWELPLKDDLTPAATAWSRTGPFPIVTATERKEWSPVHGHGVRFGWSSTSVSTAAPVLITWDGTAEVGSAAAPYTATTAAAQSTTWTVFAIGEWVYQLSTYSSARWVSAKIVAT